MNQKKIDISLLLLMIFQTIISIVFPIYLDNSWVQDTWFGNDLITLLIVCPMFLLSIIKNRSVFKLLHLGCTGYIVYNYIFYLLGTEINSMFIVYILLVLCGIISLINIFTTDTDAKHAYNYFSSTENHLVPAIIFTFIGTGLGLVWLSMWFSNIFFNGKLPVASTEFRLVASLDLVIIVPLMIISGVLLFKKKVLGLITGSIIGIQGSLYLLILTINSARISIKQSVMSTELPIWIFLLFICIFGISSLLIKGKKS